MDGTETGWGRPAEPAPRWRALLDRARHARNTADEPAEPEAPQPQQSPQQYSQPLPTRRPVNPLDSRGPYERAPASGFEPRRSEPATPPRPINPLDPRWQARQAEARQAEARQAESWQGEAREPWQGETREPWQAEPAGRRSDPASFFSPTARSAPVAPPQPRDYPQIRASAAAPVIPPPVQPQPVQPAPQSRPAAPQPTSPAAARIEWRQTRPDDERERAVAVMRRKLGTPRVLAFANPKGGVHKTTATVLAAATIGSVRGRGVLAWDDNELRGTLGLRAGSARHARTIKHLLADLLQIENLHGDALLQELDGYLRHASDGSYDVLAGEENPRFAQRLDQGTVRRVMDLLRRTHDVICVDTGNNVESVNWQTVMRQADQLVITTVPREDAAFTADWMLDVLDESGMGDLVANAVTLISCPSPGPLPLLDDFVKHFKTRTRAVAVVPYDPALEVGSSIEYHDLQLETREAWLRAASVMIEPFAE